LGLREQKGQGEWDGTPSATKTAFLASLLHVHVRVMENYATYEGPTHILSQEPTHTIHKIWTAY